MVIPYWFFMRALFTSFEVKEFKEPNQECNMYLMYEIQYVEYFMVDKPR